MLQGKCRPRAAVWIAAFCLTLSPPLAVHHAPTLTTSAILWGPLSMSIFLEAGTWLAERRSIGCCGRLGFHSSAADHLNILVSEWHQGSDTQPKSSKQQPICDRTHCPVALIFEGVIFDLH